MNDAMIDKKFDNWTVLCKAIVDKPGRYYECMCSCGNIRLKAGTELRAGRGKQCQECQYRDLYDTEKRVGERYGKWTILKFVDMHRKLQRFECECDCGYKRMHLASELKSGKSTQCINCHNRNNALQNTKHGMHQSKIYKIWTSMLQRCNNAHDKAYKWYGQRGIKVCERWHKFDNFYEDMGNRPQGMSLDRINNDLGYSPENCKWSTHKEQMNNTRRNKKKTE